MGASVVGKQTLMLTIISLQVRMADIIVRTSGDTRERRGSLYEVHIVSFGVF